jgi:hypothetical protein
MSLFHPYLANYQQQSLKFYSQPKSTMYLPRIPNHYFRMSSIPTKYERKVNILSISNMVLVYQLSKAEFDLASEHDFQL